MDNPNEIAVNIEPNTKEDHKDLPVSTTLLQRMQVVDPLTSPDLPLLSSSHAATNGSEPSL